MKEDRYTPLDKLYSIYLNDTDAPPTGSDHRSIQKIKMEVLRMNEEQRCSMCGAAHEILEPFDGHLLCPSCLDEQTCFCSRCGQRFWADRNRDTEDQPLCPDCFESYYTTCSECGAVLPLGDVYYDDDGDRELCCFCYNQFSLVKAIQDY